MISLWRGRLRGNDGALKAVQFLAWPQMRNLQADLVPASLAPRGPFRPLAANQLAPAARSPVPTSGRAPVKRRRSVGCALCANFTGKCDTGTRAANACV